MKHLSAILLALLLSCSFALQAQNTPQVDITIDSITTTTFTVSFAKNDACTHYSILTDVVGGLETFLPMFGSLEAMISSWGISYTTDATYTWTQMIPATEYVVYVLASDDETNVIYTDTLSTSTLGGHGTSIITLSVDNIGDTCVTTTAIANDQTAFFKDFIIEKRAFDTLPLNTVLYWLKNQYETHYETDVWQWLTLDPGTDYYFCAIGVNADNVWGDLATLEFRTTGQSGIEGITPVTFTTYPNPATTQVSLQGITPGTEIRIYDLLGILRHSQRYDGTPIDLSPLPAGTYLLCTPYGTTKISKK